MTAQTIYGVQIHTGNSAEILKSLPEQSIHTCVTSPPYWGLRDYGVAGQLGLEATPQEYVENMVAVFREVRRVLRDDGTLWLNLGDSYAGSGRGGHVGSKSTLEGSTESEQQSRIARGSQLAPGLHTAAAAAGQIGRAWVPPPPGLKQKDLVGIPWRVAFALQADGWWLRQDIIWSKPNPMPESVTDRCTKAHEYLFMLAKSERYYYDTKAMAEPCVSRQPFRFVDGGEDKQRGHTRRHAGFNGRYRDRILKDGAPKTRNRRSVWTVTTKPFKGAHFATFPPDLIEPCVLAGSPMGGIVLDPFGGAGTTGLVAARRGRQAVLCELNPEYVEMAVKRIENDECAKAVNELI